MPDMTPERAIEFLLHVTACSGPFDYFEPEQNEALRMGAAALAEVAALRAEVGGLRSQRHEFDCRYTIGNVADVSGSHCPLEEPCQRCRLERVEAENEKLKADDLGAIAKQIVEAFITLRRTGLDADRDRFDAMIDDYLEITGRSRTVLTTVPRLPVAPIDEALRAELAEAKAMLAKVEHEEPSYEPGSCYRDCVACARDARWPKKEGT